MSTLGAELTEVIQGGVGVSKRISRNDATERLPCDRVAPPPLWGTPQVIRERLGAAVRDVIFDRATMLVPALSVAHHREITERTAGPVLKLVESLSLADPASTSRLSAGVRRHRRGVFRG